MGIFKNNDDIRPQVKRRDIKGIKDIDKYADLVAEKTGWDRSKALNEIAFANRHLGITPKFYYSNELYNKTEIGMVRFVMNKKKEGDKKEGSYGKISERTGLSVEKLQENRKKVNKMAGKTFIGADSFILYELYDFDPETEEDAIMARLEEIKKLKEKEASIIEKFKKIDKGELTYADVEDDYREYCENEINVITERRFIANANKLAVIMPEIRDMSREEKIKWGVDMEATRRLLKFTPGEYICFDFAKRNLENRREFVSGKNKTEIIRKLNTPAASDIFNSKYDSYINLKPFYKREMEMIYGVDDIKKFKAFLKKHPVCVKKDNYESMGKGVQLIRTDKNTDYEELLKSLAGRTDIIILEELIEPHETIRYLNPDSVNTVRIVTLVKDGVVTIEDSFMKVGRSGSFVDNGGSGGIFVHVDKDTGEFDSPGIIETGVRFVNHPDHGYPFQEYALKDWNQAIEIAKKAALVVEGAGYIGWDFTLNSKGEWVIVEGNALTQFIGQQATVNMPKKKELLEHTGLTIETSY